jgi:rhodanese-related sulfurtransferase
MASAGVETHGVQRGLPADAKRLVETKQVIVVDVREANELASGMALGAMHMPLSQVEADGPEFKKFLAGLPKDKEIWFYCRSGRRSGIVSEKMNSLGFRVRNAGGFSDWQSAGLPTK